MARKAKNPLRRHPVVIDYQGTVWHGDYTVSGGMVEVDTDFGSKSAVLLPAKVLAKMLLRELVQERAP